LIAIASSSSLLLSTTYAVEASKTNVGAASGGDIFLTSPYIIPIFLSMIFAAAVLSSRTRIPHTMILVGFGIAISFFDFVGLSIVDIKQFRIDPRLIINFIIPPLIFEAMMKVNYKEFKSVRISASLLATVGVILATLVTGSLLTYIAHQPFAVAFTFAALIAPTDPAIVIEIFKRIRVPKQLSTLMEFEASFNDATGLIVFSSIIALVSASTASTGYNTIGNSSSLGITSPNDTGSVSNASSTVPVFPPTMTSLSFVGETEHFAIVFFGGAAVGLVIAAATHRLHALMNDPFSETALTVATVFGSVVAANSLGLSGLVAVAVAGLYFGNITVKQEAYMSLKVRNSVFNFWEMIAFFANSAAFVYLGINMNIFNIGQNFLLIALSFAAVLTARVASTYPLLAATNKFTKEKIPRVWRHIVVLGGMRGALSVALVASLPESSFKNTIATITFGVVLSSLIIQYIGLTQYVKKVFPEQKKEGNGSTIHTY
jgi:monovalent cation:H+ antiporter, CPA1 family